MRRFHNLYWSANVDRKFYCDTDLQSMTSNPVKSTKSIGGVARNIGKLRETW